MRRCLGFEGGYGVFGSGLMRGDLNSDILHTPTLKDPNLASLNHRQSARFTFAYIFYVKIIQHLGCFYNMTWSIEWVFVCKSIMKYMQTRGQEQCKSSKFWQGRMTSRIAPQRSNASPLEETNKLVDGGCRKTFQKRHDAYTKSCNKFS